jgi:hypothetical protein
MGSAAVGAGIDCLEVFRGFADAVGVGLGTGSALFERILEKAIGSVGLLGVAAAAVGSCLMAEPPNPTPLCRISGEVTAAILGECDIEDTGPIGCACETGDCGGNVAVTGEV